MNEDNIKRVIDLAEQGLTSLSDKLGVALPRLWEVLIRQQYVNFIQDLVVFIALGFTLRWFFGWSTKLVNDNKNTWDDSPAFLRIFGTIIITGALIVTFGFLVYRLGGVINPEYYALRDIANFIHY